MGIIAIKQKHVKNMYRYPKIELFNKNRVNNIKKACFYVELMNQLI